MRRPAVFLLGLLWCVVCVADYDAGNAAYKEGDKATALAQWQPLAEAGDAPAQYGLGLIYEYGGGGVDRNYPRAAIWYRLAAEQGKTNAQAALGYLYRNGLGVEQDDAEAFAWYQRSAEAGNRRGQYRLAFMYRYGHGVERDYSRALEWLHKSAAQQYPYAYVRLGDMYRRGLGVASDLGEAVRSTSARPSVTSARCSSSSLDFIPAGPGFRRTGRWPKRCSTKRPSTETSWNPCMHVSTHTSAVGELPSCSPACCWPWPAACTGVHCQW